MDNWKSRDWIVVTTTACVLSAIFPTSATSSPVADPDECILAAMAGTARPTDSLSVIRHACIEAYLASALPTAQILPYYSTVVGTMAWYPSVLTRQNPIPERVSVVVKNDSEQVILAVDVLLRNRKSKHQDVYRLYPETPIKPGSVEVVSGAVITTLTGADGGFGNEYVWWTVAVLAVATKPTSGLLEQFYSRTDNVGRAANVDPDLLLATLFVDAGGNLETISTMIGAQDSPRSALPVLASRMNTYLEKSHDPVLAVAAHHNEEAHAISDFDTETYVSRVVAAYKRLHDVYVAHP